MLQLFQVFLYNRERMQEIQIKRKDRETKREREREGERERGISKRKHEN